jgi:hypothetical protein
MADPKTIYNFLPWYRAGLVSAIDANPQGARGEVQVRLRTKVGNNEENRDQTVRLIGPGDITGIDPRAIVRLDPRPPANDFEPNYVAAIEFFDEDYPWRYSPRAPAGSRLHPWLALIVLAEGEFKFKNQGDGLPRSVIVEEPTALPPAEDAWAWAHTHVNAVPVDKNSPRATADALARNPALGCSRIMAPRRLQPFKSWHAILVPAFEAGRRAGLLPGAAAVDRLFAWSPGQAVELPVYFEWSFRTGERGDFEELASRLHAVEPDPRVGRRPMNMSRPLEGMPLPPIHDVGPLGRPVLDLEGALQVPSASPSAWDPPTRDAFRAELADFINIGEVWTLNVSGQPELPAGMKLPIVLPPAYGRWHASVEKLDPAQADARWFEQLNLDPRNRVASAFGTLVIQKNQEELMTRAWKQYGELFEANKLRNRAQLFREILTAVEAKHLATLPNAKLLSVTTLAHARVRQPGPEPLTVRGAIEASALPIAAVQPAMQRVVRERGRVAKRFGPETQHLTRTIGALASKQLSAAPEWEQPATRLTLSTAPPAELDEPDRRTWFAGDWDTVRPRLIEQLLATRGLIPRVRQLQANEQLLTELLRAGDAQAHMAATGLRPEALAEVREAREWIPVTVPRDRLTELDMRRAPDQPEFTLAAANFQQAMANSFEWLTMELPPAPVRAALDVQATAATLRASLSPYIAVRERVDRMTTLPPVIKMPAYDPLETIMAYPQFDDAMYEFLRKLSDEYVVPNLALMENNTVTLLEVNWRFVESYMVGLNHEMARELLWRGYPTDQRGSCFRQFWDVKGLPGARDAQGRVNETARDIHPIHGWKLGGKLTPLGENRPLGKVIKNNVVLVIRGDLLRRYPTLEVYAVQAIANLRPRTRRAFEHTLRQPGTARKDPVFRAMFPPDVFCYGFDLDRQEVEGTAEANAPNLGWYFVLAERFGEPRFGLDEPREGAPAQAGDVLDVNWGHLPGLSRSGVVNVTANRPAMPAAGFVVDATGRASWGADAGDMAAIFLQVPFRVYFHASRMLKNG